MTRTMINALSATVLAVGGLFLGAKKADAYHVQSHQGPSCGNCHCDPGEECVVIFGVICDCSSPPDESN
jgi:hypothetical protein